VLSGEVSGGGLGLGLQPIGVKNPYLTLGHKQVQAKNNRS